MSLHRWLASSNARTGVQSSYLPHAERGSSTEVANKEVQCELEIGGKKRKRARGDYHHYTAEARAKVAKYACESGNKAAVKKFSVELGYPVSEGTVRNFKRKYREQLKCVGDPDLVTSLPSASSGRPLLIGKFDDEVAEYIRNLRLSGGIVNSNILIAAAKGIIAHKNPGLLKDYGGSLDLGKKWATKAARKLPVDFPELKLTFLKRIQEEVRSKAIPLELLFNWDQTGVKLVPVSSWTMAQSGSKQIPVVGLEDKREITVLLAATAAGTLLLPQVIYQGKTTGCHAKVAFPDKWHITHSESHWSNEQTMLEYLENIIIPYVTSTRQALDLPEDQPALALFDVFAAHRSYRVLDMLKSNNIHQIFVPASCTGELQPLDVGINEQFKALLKQEFSRWYANEVQQAMRQGVVISDIKVDLRASLMKPLHANWLMCAISTLSDKCDAIKNHLKLSESLTI